MNTPLPVSNERILRALREARQQLEQAKTAGPEPIAVVGMGARFPGSGATLDSFWDDLCAGRDAVRPIPASRWDIDRYYHPDPDTPGRMYIREAALLEPVDQFDAAFFGISPREAASLDPQQRLLLETAWEALEHAAIAPEALANTRTGVFLGIGQNDYARLATAPHREAEIGTYDGTGNGFCFAAGRISYVLGLQGPNLAVDTACSSSLVAVHLAVESLRKRESDCALAAGVQLILSPEATLFLSRAKALSPDGRSRPFSANANGYGRGEGCGVLVLKRLADARAEGDRILAVIRGSAVNHDGPSSGLTVPNVKAQEALLRNALQAAGLAPEDVGYLEAHGTGTILGDPLEMRAVQAVYGAAPRPGGPLRVSSVKANIGHLEAAAGIAGLIKTILILQHGRIPPALYSDALNPRIPWSELPVEMPARLTPWTAERRIAGVSSFSLSGTNAHVLLESCPAGPPAPAAIDDPQRLLLSARSATALEARKADLRAYLEAHPDTCLADLACTLATGRAHHAVRWAAVAASVADAIAQLRGARAAGSADRDPLIARYLAGETVAWSGPRRPKLALPTYPFERQRFWLKDAAPQAANPLLARRTQSPLLDAIVFEGALSVATASFLADHRIFGEIVVPGAFHVAAVLGAARALHGDTPIELRDVVFPATLTLPDTGAVTLQLVLQPDASGAHRFTLIRIAADGTWTTHAQGVLASAALGPTREIPATADATPRDVDAMYDALERRGIGLGPAFRWIAAAESTAAEASCRMAVPPGQAAALPGYALHPGLLDSCFQLLGAATLNDDSDDTWIPFHIGRVRLSPGPLGDAGLRAVAHLRQAGGDILLLDGTTPVMEIDALEVRRHAGRREPVYTVTWREAAALPAAPSDPAAKWHITDDGRRPAAEAFREWLRQTGQPVAASPESATHIACFDDGTLHAILRLCRDPQPALRRLLVFTEGPQPASGLHAALRAEHRLWNPALIELDPAAPPADWDRLIALTATEDRLAVRDGRCEVPRLTPHTAAAAQLRLQPDRTYLITGGLGALGLRTAAWLAGQGAKHLVLASRRGAVPPAIDTLRARDVAVTVKACDIADPAAVEALIRGIQPPLAGIVHAAGVLEDGLLAQQPEVAFQRVLAPKVAGAWNLHRQTLRTPLDFFVCYSSMAALLASPGQGAYAAANAALDNLMHTRRAAGLPGLSIAWGPWDDAGMASSQALRARWNDAGIGLLDPTQALHRLGSLLADPATPAHVAVFDFARLAQRLPASERPPLLAELAPAKPKSATANQASVRRDDLLALLAQTGFSQRTELLRDYLREQAGKVLGHDAPVTERGESLIALGVDSLMAVEMRTIIGNELGRDIPVVRFLDGSGIAELAAFLAEQFSLAAPAPSAEPALAAVGEADTWMEGEL